MTSKDEKQTAMLNRMKCDQIHKGSEKANVILTYREIESDSAHIDANGFLIYKGKRYYVVGRNFATDTYTVRRANEQDS